MKTRTFAVIVTMALLILVMAGSAMCAPTGLPDQAATQAELKAIDAIQKAIDAKGYNWTAGVTSVSGLTDDEKKKLCGVKPTNDRKDKDVKEKKSHPKKLASVGTYPSTFDWHDMDGVDWMTPVRSQRSCGSCWAFSAIGVVEAKINIQANVSDIDIDLSEQHLVSDCCDAGDCGGGWSGQALDYITDTGIPGEACFPYIWGDCTCTPCENWETTKWNTVSTNYIPYQSMWKNHISGNCPISAVIGVYGDFFSYTGGVYQHVSGSFKGYHAIVVTGWNDTEGCWIIKNSWGTGWGEDGYCRIPGNYFPSQYGAYTVGDILNYVPMADASANQTCGTAPLDVAFTGTGSDSDGTVVSYEWTFGDGASSTSQNPTHTYNSPGTYTATLTVTDDDGATGSDSVEIVSGICGDVNGDGNVNFLDVGRLADYVTHGSPPVNECAADVTGDGNVNMLDVTRLADYVTHGSPPLNCQC